MRRRKEETRQKNVGQKNMIEQVYVDLDSSIFLPNIFLPRFSSFQKKRVAIVTSLPFIVCAVGSVTSPPSALIRRFDIRGLEFIT